MGRNRDITLTPRDFNYDNHHYQYLKYSKRAKVRVKNLLFLRVDNRHCFQ